MDNRASTRAAGGTRGRSTEPIDESGLLGVKVDDDVLVEQMIHVIEHRDEARVKGEIAARTLPAMLNWDRVVANVLDITT